MSNILELVLWLRDHFGVPMLIVFPPEEVVPVVEGELWARGEPLAVVDLPQGLGGDLLHGLGGHGLERGDGPCGWLMMMMIPHSLMEGR